MLSATIRQKLFPLMTRQIVLERILARSRDPMTKGSLFQWYTACRKGHCKCTRGQKHGPFLYAAVRLKGKTVQRYVGKEGDAGLVKKLEAYREFRKKRTELNRLNQQLYRGWQDLEKSLLKGHL